MLGTLPTKAVAGELLKRPNDTRWSREIAFAIKANEGMEIGRGSVVRILAKMETEGWVTSRRELREDCRTRLPRLYFQVTPLGFEKLNEFLGIEPKEVKSLIMAGQ